MSVPDTTHRHSHLQYKICVSGASETGHCGPDALEQAKALGRAIVKQGAVLVTGATTGFPLWAAIGAKEAGGLSIGISPASSEREHVEVYGLPLDYLDLVIYTGFGYSGRNLLLTRASDAVVVGCGRVGTINEFTVAFEDGKPLGVLEGAWATADVIRDIMRKGERTRDRIVFASDPHELVTKLVAILDTEKSHEHRYANPGNSLGQAITDGGYQPVL